MARHNPMFVMARRIFWPIAALLALGGCGDSERARKQPEPVGLYTSLPILWPETGELSHLLDINARRHWALEVLEKRGTIQPIDSLAASGGALPLPAKGLLVMAQPRPLAPDENVVLDIWVRDGGRLLLFADPLLTAESGFALGDKRRPQDVALLSPILTRWGLELQFDEAQPPGENMVSLLGGAMPVSLPGRFVVLDNSRGCAKLGSGLAVSCRIGAGRVLAVADAAVLEDASVQAIPVRSAALDRLLASLESGD